MPDFQFVTERLAIGGAIYTLENMRDIAGSGITHVVNLQQEFDDRAIIADTGVQVLWLGCLDDFLPKPPELFWDGVLFTLEALQQKKSRVLFHCLAGIHRSPMMLLAVMRVLGFEAQRAMQSIVHVRPQAEFPDVYNDSIEEFLIEYRAGMSTRAGGGFDPDDLKDF